MNALPKPYEEVFIWWKDSRRIARLNAVQTHFQLATFLADTKGQYLVPVEKIQRWSSIQELASI